VGSVGCKHTIILLLFYILLILLLFLFLVILVAIFLGFGLLVPATGVLAQPLNVTG
jgi:hypothetical protein